MPKSNGEFYRELLFPSERPNELWFRVHHAMRGRYRLAALLVAALALMGVAIANHQARPMYLSTGLLDLNPARAKLDSSLEQPGPSRGRLFSRAQLRFLTSRQVLEKALDDPRMQRTGWPVAEEGLHRLRQFVDTDYVNDESIITIRVRNESPTRAQSGVNALLDAYMSFRCERLREAASRAHEILARRVADCRARHAELRRRLGEIAAPYGGVDALQASQDAQRRQLDRINDLLMDLDGPATSLSDADTRQRERTLADLRSELAAALAHRGALFSRFGPNHPTVVGVNLRIDALQELTTIHESTAGVSASATPGELAAARRRAEQRRAQVTADLRQLSGAAAEVAALQAQLESHGWQLRELMIQQQQAAQDANHAQPIDAAIASYGELPMHVSTGRQRAALMLGAGGGAVAAIALMLGLALLDRRCRVPEQLEQLDTAATLWAVMPQWTGDPRVRELAERCVHQLRHRLLSSGPAEGVPLFAFTSPGPGDGKSRLALAVARSFAASGCRTLMIDADLIGAGLTRRTGTTGRPGLTDLIAGPLGAAAIHATHTDNLAICPTGQAPGITPDRLSVAVVHRIVEQAAGRFDVIIADTGPALQATEASPVISLADRSLLVVGRDRPLAAVQATLDHFEQLGNDRVALVFNKARLADAARRYGGAGSRSRSSGGDQAPHEEPAAHAADSAEPIFHLKQLRRGA